MSLKEREYQERNGRPGGRAFGFSSPGKGCRNSFSPAEWGRVIAVSAATGFGLVSLAAVADGGLEEPELRAIKEPIEIAGAYWWLGWVLAVLAILALAYWAWRRSRRKKGETKLRAPSLPPHVKAWRKLEESLALLDQPRPFCISVSDAIRTYCEERFDLRAPERTTEEFLDELQSSAALTGDQKKLLGEFLGECDLVKFARYEPAREELKRIHGAAFHLVKETARTVESSTGLDHVQARNGSGKPAGSSEGRPVKPARSTDRAEQTRLVNE